MWTGLVGVLADAVTAAPQEVAEAAAEAGAADPTRAEVMGQAVTILFQGMASIFVFMALFWGLIVLLDRVYGKPTPGDEAEAGG